MVVFGDRPQTVSARSKLASIRECLRASASLGGIERHQLLVAALIEAGELSQGLLDSEFEVRGRRDARSPLGDASMAATAMLARSVALSWASAFARAGDPVAMEEALAELETHPWPESVTVRQPEGFAHYAVYPESFLEAARPLRGSAEFEVIGIRSIGTSLAAAVAAALDAPPPVTVRPVGHPFQRELNVDDSLADEIRGKRSRSFVVVDEGPGLSGSSFAAVSRALTRLGVPEDRVRFVPSHANPPGPQASAETRAIWARHPRHPAASDEALLDGPRDARRLGRWVSDLVGLTLRPLRDVSGGAWRGVRYASQTEWPPVVAWQERRKFLADTESGTWLLKFAGLGRLGLRRAERAADLATAGFAPESAGWRHGFLVERWREDAAPLTPEDIRSETFRRHLGRYLGFRAAAFPAGPGRGASLAQLREMALSNTAEALGEAVARELAARMPSPERLARQARPVETDNRLLAWEWLRLGEGFLKTDGVDHHDGHDLIGCQDIAWDIAAAAAEFSLGPRELESLMELVEQGNSSMVVSELVDFLRPVYVGFMLGYWSASWSTGDGEDEQRARTMSSRYRGLLLTWLRKEGTVADI